MYAFTCEHCDGTVRERRVEREALRHKGNFIILEDVPVGVCDKCGARYFDFTRSRKEGRAMTTFFRHYRQRGPVNALQMRLQG